MKRARVLLAAGLIIASCLAAPPALSWLRAETLPESLTDREFWKLSSGASEEAGWFRSDNLLSNELSYPAVVADLTKAVPAARVYMGVGPEQNFNYIAALKPKMAFIVDIRRGNLDVQLMYKALFELSADRAEFISRLFSRPRPEGLAPSATPEELFAAFGTVKQSDELKNSNLLALKTTLVATHHFELAPEDLTNITTAYEAFVNFGPDIRYSSSQAGGFGGFNQPSYAELMAAADRDGRPRSYLATEQSFRVLKDLETKNMLVPVVGNFGGPKAIRAVGQYVREHGSVVSAFYLSNVEMYLYQQNLWDTFCRNVASLPVDATSSFIRSSRGGGYGRGFGLMLSVSEIAPEVKDCK